MKAISIKQPWASLIVEGIKDIENRTWECPKKYIGQRVLVHACAGSGNKFKINLTDEQTIAAFGSIAKNATEGAFHFGAIIGSVEIVDCVVNHPSIWAEKTKLERVWANKTESFIPCVPIIYNWVLANPIKFSTPIPIKGNHFFWESECEILICPKCGGYCLHDNHDVDIPNWGNPVHECEYCKNMILESEFEFLK